MEIPSDFSEESDKLTLNFQAEVNNRSMSPPFAPFPTGGRDFTSFGDTLQSERKIENIIYDTSLITYEQDNDKEEEEESDFQEILENENAENNTDRKNTANFFWNHPSSLKNQSNAIESTIVYPKSTDTLFASQNTSMTNLNGIEEDEWEGKCRKISNSIHLGKYTSIYQNEDLCDSVSSLFKEWLLRKDHVFSGTFKELMDVEGSKQSFNTMPIES